MTVLVAPDSFKGTFTAPEVAAAIAQGLRSRGETALEMPVADGGEGTLDVLATPLQLAVHTGTVSNPWGHPVPARWGLSTNGTAVVELAQSAGLHVQHPGARDPRLASTSGVGQQISAAVAAGARHVVVCVGGSATTDGGAGAVEVLRSTGELGGARLTVLCDTRTVFTDAAQVFGAQKGAGPEDVRWLTERLQAQREAMPRNPDTVPGSGAAGGFAGAMWAHFGAELTSGADFVLEAIGMPHVARKASAVVVGEGRLDGQTATGKVISRILVHAQSLPVHAIVGSVGPGVDDLGAAFADVTVASSLAELTAAGAALADRRRLTREGARPASE